MAAYDVTKLGSGLEFDTIGGEQKRIEKLTDTRFIIAWEQQNSVHLVQCFSVNKTTGAITALGSPVDIGTDTALDVPDIVIDIIDETHFAIFYRGNSNDGYVRTYSVNESTGAITEWGSAVEFDKSNATDISSCFLYSDATYAYIYTCWFNGDDLIDQIFRITLSDGTISKLGSENIISGDGRFSNCVKLSNNRVLLYCADYNSGGSPTKYSSVRVRTVNTSTWEISSSTSLSLDEGGEYVPGLEIILSSEITAVMLKRNGTTGYYNFVPMVVNPSTFSTTLLGSFVNLVADSQYYSINTIKRIDDTHFIVFYTGADGDGFVRTYSFNNSTGAMSVIDELEFDTSDATNISSCDMGDNIYIGAWTGTDLDGFVQTFFVEPPALGPANLKSYNTNLKANIKTINTNPIANVKSLNTNV